MPESTIGTKTFEEIFSEAERDVIKKCMESGQFDSVPSALESAGFLEMTPEKERALQEYLNVERPISLDTESEVMAELQQKEIKEGYKIETQEEEAYWQKRLDDERTGKLAKLKGEVIPDVSITDSKDNADAISPSSPLPDDPDEIDMTKAEICSALKVLEIKFDPNKSKAELSKILDSSKKN